MRRILQLDIAAVAARDVARNGKPEPNSTGGRIARAVQANERLEHPVALFRRDSPPILVDQDIDPVFDPYARHPDVPPETAGIGDEVVHATPESVGPNRAYNPERLPDCRGTAISPA